MKFKYRRYYLYYLARAFASLWYVIPFGLGLCVSSLLGRLLFALLVQYRSLTIGNLTSAFGRERSRSEIAGIGRRVFENLARNAYELVNFPKINASNIDSFVSIQNRGAIDRALAKGRGAIVLTGHFGNWELLASAIRIKGYEGAVVGRRIYFDRYDRYLNAIRNSHNVQVIYRDESPKKILRVLKENKIIGMLADQDVDSVDGVFVNFFGRPAYTPAGPVLLARASGASLIPAFVIRDGPRRHTIAIEEPVELVDTGNREVDIVTNTQRWSDVVERYIRRYPDHWVWMHRRWKTQAVEK